MTTPVATRRPPVRPAFPPPPRSVRRQIGGGCAIAGLRLFTLPHALIGIALLFYATTRVYVHYLGTPVTATVDRGSLRDHGHAYNRAWFHYVLHGERHNGSMRVSANLASAADSGHVGRTFTGRAAAPLGVGVFMPDNDSITGDTLPVVLFALVFNGILLISLDRVWIEPVRQRWVAKHGEAVIGTVTGMRRRRGRGGRCVVSYAFTTPDGHSMCGKCDASSTAFAHVRDGAAVTVLYDPARPQRSLPYQFCDFVVERQP